jgi:beta-glucosidase
MVAHYIAEGHLPPEGLTFVEKGDYEAISAPMDMLGVNYYWTLIDNFEWARGFARRFGMVWVDTKTPERVPKDSAQWYSDVIKKNAVKV